MATSAYILIETEVGKIKDMLKTLGRIKEVKSVEAVTGLYDIIANVEAKDINVLGRVVADKIQRVRGIRRTVTCTIADL